jgi:hypothetical protein
LRGDDAVVDRVRAEVEAWSMSRFASDLRQVLDEPIPDLVGWWRLDEKEGTSAHDASGQESHGRLVGNPAWLPSGGRIGGALLFKGYDGSDDCVELPLTPAIDGLHRSDFTIAAWFRPDSVPPGRDAENNAYYGILIRPGMHVGLSYQSSRLIGMSLWVGKGDQVPDLVHGTPCPPGAWHHAAATVSMREGRAVLYLNGRRSRTSSFKAGSAPHQFGGAPWRIGIAAPGQSEWRWAMDGAVDDVRFYSRVLSDTDVLDLFQSAGS